MVNICHNCLATHLISYQECIIGQVCNTYSSSNNITPWIWHHDIMTATLCTNLALTPDPIPSPSAFNVEAKMLEKGLGFRLIVASIVGHEATVQYIS